MVAARRFSYEEFKQGFAQYGLRRCSTICNDPIIELWELGWGEPLTLTPEDGYYDEFQWRRIQILINNTIPPGWNLNRKK